MEINQYNLQELIDTYSHHLAELNNILWGLELYGKLTRQGQELYTTFDIEQMLTESLCK